MTTASAGKPLLFLDWLHVNRGSMEISLDESRLSEAGRKLAEQDRTRTGGVFPDLSNRGMVRRRVPFGIRITVEKGKVSEPWLLPDQPWERDIAWVTVIQEQGQYRCWYHARLPATPDQPDRGYRLCYAQSDDGWNWVKPTLNVYPFNGSTVNNITGPFGFEASVFRDDHGPPEQRYKTFDRESSHPAAPGEPQRERGLYVCVSPDGLRWQRHPNRVIQNFCDSQNIACWDQEHQRYIGYLRSRLAGRAVAISETDDFFNWPEPRVVLYPGSEEGPTIDYYTPGYTAYPGVPGLRLFFVSIYCHASDQVHTRLALSHDGRTLAWASREPIVDPLPRGSVYAGPNLVRLGDGRLAMPCRLSGKPHNASHENFYGHNDTAARDTPESCAGWITWEQDRLAGIEADNYGEFFTNPIICDGNEIEINARTAIAGDIQIELWEVTTGRHGKPIPGYTFDECQSIRGDVAWQAVRWNNRSNLAALRGREIELRIRLSGAKIFGARQK